MYEATHIMGEKMKSSSEFSFSRAVEIRQGNVLLVGKLIAVLLALLGQVVDHDLFKTLPVKAHFPNGRHLHLWDRLDNVLRVNGYLCVNVPQQGWDDGGVDSPRLGVVVEQFFQNCDKNAKNYFKDFQCVLRYLHEWDS